MCVFDNSNTLFYLPYSVSEHLSYSHIGEESLSPETPFGGRHWPADWYESVVPSEVKGYPLTTSQYNMQWVSAKGAKQTARKA